MSCAKNKIKTNNIRIMNNNQHDDYVNHLGNVKLKIAIGN